MLDGPSQDRDRWLKGAALADDLRVAAWPVRRRLEATAKPGGRTASE